MCVSVFAYIIFDFHYDPTLCLLLRNYVLPAVYIRVLHQIVTILEHTMGTSVYRLYRMYMYVHCDLCLTVVPLPPICNTNNSQFRLLNMYLLRLYSAFSPLVSLLL
jgi:hypothetical protein